jgi:3-methyladenine DNA glycosylase Tag
MSPDYNYEVPARSVPDNDAGYLEKITQAVFQSGFSWAVIRSKWPNFQAAFANFNVDEVAAFNDEDVERLMEDKSIVRNGRKIEATLQNARTIQDLVAKHGSFYAFLRTMDGFDYETRAQKLCRTFKFLGPMGAYFFFYSVGEEVPEYHEWRARHEAS